MLHGKWVEDVIAGQFGTLVNLVLTCCAAYVKLRMYQTIQYDAIRCEM